MGDFEGTHMFLNQETREVINFTMLLMSDNIIKKVEYWAK